MPAKHHLADRPHLLIEDQKDEKWVKIEKGISPIIKNLDAITQQAGFDRMSNIDPDALFSNFFLQQVITWNTSKATPIIIAIGEAIGEYYENNF